MGPLSFVISKHQVRRRTKGHSGRSGFQCVCINVHKFIYVYFALFCVYVCIIYVPLSGPQCERFDYTMHFVTLPKTYDIYSDTAANEDNSFRNHIR